MIPVLFESTETKFDTSVSNGLGRLYEATSCICTEKRNGEYYLTMEYPFASEMYKYLEKGRYILAEPSSNYRPQPFEIDTISRPMGGIVTVTAWHISDHLRYIPVMPFTASSCADALNKLKTYSSEPNPFTVWTDKNVTAPFTNKVPRSFKACLGGEENSLLDVFGTAEYEFDMYNVKMHLHRGKNRGVTVRYGVNLKDLKQEDSIANTVTGITPYWHGTVDQKDVTVVLPEKNIQSDKADRFPYHRTEAVDLSSVIKLPEKVKQPTVEMLREAAKTYMKGKSYGVPDVSLTVSYEDLAGTEEYSSDETLQVNLCDTITVIFENLNVNATAEVISVEYDVLKEAYTKLELGSYKDTLSKIIYQSSIMQNNLVSAVQTIESNSSDTESRLIAEYVKQNQIILDDTKATTDALSKKIDDETARATNAENANNKLITDHKADTSNPHKVTKAQVGLGNVDNTADSAKSVKYATSAGSANSVAWGNVSGKPSTYPPSGHTHTKDQVGLGNVANIDQSKAIKSITRSGTTFTATALDGTTTTFTQQDANTTYGLASQSSNGLMSAADKKAVDREFFRMLPKGGTRIPAKADLNSIQYLKVGCYYNPLSADAATMKNCPGGAFIMYVLSPLSEVYDNESTSTWVYRLRIFVEYTGNIISVQFVYSGATVGSFSYGPWVKMTNSNDLSAVSDTIDTHITNKSNPHGVTKSQVGLGNVDNTADSAKSVKYATSAGSANSVAWGNVSGKPSTYPPSSHTHSYLPLSGGNMTGQILTSFKNSVAVGSYQAAATTIPKLVEELRYSSGCMGSASISAAYGQMPTGWYNFIYIPHRSGGKNGSAVGDNCNYGNLILIGMTMTNQAWIVNFISGNIESYFSIRNTDTNTNTTYTLTKSGSTITLTGSDGSKTSVTDATGNNASAMTNATIDSICV